MTTHADISDPFDVAHAALAYAEECGVSAREAREHGEASTRRGAHDTANEAHRLAGRFREEQRAATKRAEVYLALSQAKSLYRIATTLDRFDLRS